MTIKIVFAGTPEIAVPSLKALLSSDYAIVSVYTQPDRAAGRGKKLLASPVKQLAEAHHLVVKQPLTLKDEMAQQELRRLRPDLIVVVAYGMILPKAVLDIPRLGCINMHPSLLPAWRGPAPIQYSLLHGDRQTGVSIMLLTEKMDAGPILQQVSCPIGAQETSDELHQRLGELGAEVLVSTIGSWITKKIIPLPQDENLASYSHKIHKTDAQINWALSATQIVNAVRAYHSWPMAHTFYQGEVLRIWRAIASDVAVSQAPGTVVKCSANLLEVAAGTGTVQLQEVQLPGGRCLAIKDFINAEKNKIMVGVTKLG